MTCVEMTAVVVTKGTLRAMGRPRVFRWYDQWAVTFPPANTSSSNPGAMCPLMYSWTDAMRLAGAWWTAFKDVRL